MLCSSLDERRIELITLTSSSNGTGEIEERYGDVLFPEKVVERAQKFINKPYLFISCRVHAGETPASYMMKGLLNFLREYKTNEDAWMFLERFVLILIPMLNPDGVYRGHYRLDALGYDLNRVYNRRYKKYKFPGPYAVLETAKYY